MKYRGEGINRIPREFRKGNLSSVLRAQTNFQEKSIAFVSHFARIFFCDEFSGMIFGICPPANWKGWVGEVCCLSDDVAKA